jgi:hypothetical protein
MRIPIVIALLAWSGPALAALSCPDRLAEIPPAPFERGGLGAGRGANSPLQEVWMVDGVPGDEAAGAPAILHPDEMRGRPPRAINTCHIPADEPRLLVCIYGQGTWLRAALPHGLKRCVQTAEPHRMGRRCD